MGIGVGFDVPKLFLFALEHKFRKPVVVCDVLMNLAKLSHYNYDIFDRRPCESPTI